MDKRILCFGDSNTWGYTAVTGERHPEGVRWTSLLKEKLGCTVIEEGLNGRTSAFPDRLLPYGTGTDYIQACVASQAPLDLLIIMLGTNDMKYYVCNCADASAKGVMMVGNLAKAILPELKILIISPAPIGRFRPELGAMMQLNIDSIENSWKLADRLKEQAELNGFYFMDAAEYAEVSKEDAVHLDAENHAKLADAVAKKVKEIFAEN